MKSTSEDGARRTRTVLGAALAVSVVVIALLAVALRDGEPPREIRLEAARIEAVPAREPALVEDDVGAGPVRASELPTSSAISADREPQRVDMSASAVIRALAQSLADGAYERRSFETEARARLANATIDELATCSEPDAGVGFAVARASLLRVASATQPFDEPRLTGEELAVLRAAFADGSQPRGVLEQAGAALAALGDDGDRARLFAALAGAVPAEAPSLRAAAAARIALESLAGPGAATALAAEVSAELERGSAGPVLAVASSWTSARASALDDGERAACAATFASLAERTSLEPRARARVLACLLALDRERAADVARGWLADPAAPPELARAACTSIRAGDLDAASVLTLATDATASTDRRLEIASAFLGSVSAQDDAELAASIRAVVRDLRPDGGDRRLRPRELR